MRPLETVLPVVAALAWMTGGPLTAQTADTALAARVTEAEFLAPFSAVAADGGEEAAAVVVRSETVGLRRADLAAARQLEDPVLSAEREDGEAVESALTVAWRPPRPDRRRLERAAAEADLAAAEAAVASSQALLDLELRRVFADWALARERLAPRERELEALAELVRRAEERARVGEGSGLDHRRLTLAAAETRAEVARARAELAIAEAAARAWRPELPPEAVPEVPPLPPPAEPGATTHPEVAALERELRAAELREELAGKVFDLPEAVAGWKWVDVEPAPGEEETVSGPVVGLAWTVPLFDRGGPERLRAETRRRTAAARLDLLERRLAAEEAGARSAYETLLAAAREAAEAAEAGPPAVEAATLAFRLGEAPPRCSKPCGAPPPRGSPPWRSMETPWRPGERSTGCWARRTETDHEVFPRPALPPRPRPGGRPGRRLRR